MLAAVRRAIPGPGKAVKDYDAVHDAAMLLHDVAVKRNMDRLNPPPSSPTLSSFVPPSLSSKNQPLMNSSFLYALAAGTWIRARATRCGRGGTWSSAPAAVTSAATAPTATPASPTPATSDPARPHSSSGDGDDALRRQMLPTGWEVSASPSEPTPNADPAPPGPGGSQSRPHVRVAARRKALRDACFASRAAQRSGLGVRGRLPVAHPASLLGLGRAFALLGWEAVACVPGLSSESLMTADSATVTSGRAGLRLT